MTSVVVGLGKTGASCLRYFAKHGIAAAATDSRAAPPGLAELGPLSRTLDLRLGGFDLSLLEGASQVLISPGVSLDEPIARAARARGIEVLGDVELFARAVRAPVIGITGTNGKSTVTSSGREHGERGGAPGARRRQSRCAGARSAGGKLLPISTCSSCRAFNWKPPRRSHLQAAVVLNVTADHMDRYATVQDYARAKQRIFSHAATMVLNADDPLVAAMGGGTNELQVNRGAANRGASPGAPGPGTRTRHQDLFDAATRCRLFACCARAARRCWRATAWPYST